LQRTFVALLSGESKWQPMIGGTIKPDVVWFEGSFMSDFSAGGYARAGKESTSVIAYSAIVKVQSLSHSRRLPFH